MYIIHIHIERLRNRHPLSKPQEKQ